jgi:hypothetical protein
VKSYEVLQSAAPLSEALARSLTCKAASRLKHGMNDVFNYIWDLLFSSLAVRKEMEKKNKPPKNLLLAEPMTWAFRFRFTLLS